MERYSVTLASQNVKPLFDGDYEVQVCLLGHHVQPCSIKSWTLALPERKIECKSS